MCENGWEHDLMNKDLFFYVTNIKMGNILTTIWNYRPYQKKNVSTNYICTEEEEDDADGASYYYYYEKGTRYHYENDVY
jgi:hypothetical protein